VKSCPKPTRFPKKGKRKAKPRQICPRCGVYSIGDEMHDTLCDHSIPIIRFPRVKKTEKQLLEMAVEVLIKKIVWWLWGGECVLKEMDGVNCWGVPTLGHVIARQYSAFLKWNLSNNAVQCQGHNGIHEHGDPIYFIWYEKKFGRLALEMLRAIGKQKSKEKVELSVLELRDLLAQLNELNDDTHAHGMDTLSELVDAGYLGDIIKDAWVKEARC